VNTIKPPRSMSQIYYDFAANALKLAARADAVADFAKTKEDKDIAVGSAAFARRFSKKAFKAGETVICLMNDGELKAYCQQFDTVLAQFVAFAEKAEKELYAIEQRLK